MATASDNQMMPPEPLKKKKDALTEYLKQQGYPVTDQDISPHELFEAKNERFLNLFLDFIDNKENHYYFEVPDCDGRTPLLTAVRCKQPEALKKLLDAGANINARDDRGYGVLHHLVLKFAEANLQTEEQQQQEEVQEPLLDVVFDPPQAETQQQQAEEQHLRGLIVDSLQEKQQQRVKEQPQQTEEQQQQAKEQDPLLVMMNLLFSHPYDKNLNLKPRGGPYDMTPLKLAAYKLQENKYPGLNKLHEKLADAVRKEENSSSNSPPYQVVVDQVKENRLEKGYKSPGLYKLQEMLKEEVKQKMENSPSKSISRPKAAEVVDLVIKDRSGDELKEVLERNESNEGIFTNRSGDEVRKVLKRKENNEVNRFQEKPELVNQKIGRYSLLFYAVNNNNSSMVKVLLEFGADPWKEEIWARELPLHRAAAKGNVKIFTILLNKMMDVRNNNNLGEYSYSLIKKLLENSDRRGKDVDHLKCFHLLLENGVNLDVNQISSISGKTPLRLAAEYNNEKAILGLLQAGAFLGCSNDSEKDGHRIWDILPKGILPRAMDRLITQEDYKLRLDYRFLLPPQEGLNVNEGERMKEMKTLIDMYDSGKHRDTIKHPLVKTLLHAKWSKANRFHYIDLAFCFVFLVLLGIFVYLLKDREESTQTTMYVMKGLLLLCCVMMFLRKRFQFKSREINYFNNFDNILDLLLPVMVLVLIFTPVNFSRHFAACVIIAACLQFTLTSGRTPDFTLYIKMLRCVSWNYLKLMPFFILLIICFTLSFTVNFLPPNENEHENGNGNGNFWEMFLETISMSMGNLDFSSLSETFPTTVMARISAIFVFFSFVFGIIMVTMNVMNGLAVISTKEVKDEAELYKLISQLELIFMAEAFVQQWPHLNSFGNTQFLSRSNNASYLLAEIKEDSRGLLLGNMCLTMLDNDTADSLRSLRRASRNRRI